LFHSFICVLLGAFNDMSGIGPSFAADHDRHGLGITLSAGRSLLIVVQARGSVALGFSRSAAWVVRVKKNAGLPKAVRH
jgi:hypothetical protein